MTTPIPHDVTDAASLIAWFTGDLLVRHNGTTDPREPHMTMDEALLLAAKIGQPSYYGPRDYREANPWCAGTIWNVALAQSIFMNDVLGWIDRDGRFWGCGFAAHELLLHFLGVDIVDAELGGWIRISTGVQSIFTPSEPQRLKLIAMGYEAEAANMMYEGIEPKRASVKAARVIIPQPQDATS